MNFEVNLIFSIKLFFLHDQKVTTKPKYLENEKSFFFIIFKGLSMKQIIQVFLEGESPTVRD